AVVLKAMAEEPRDRYASADALATDVARYLADEPVSAYAEPVLERAQRWGRRNRTLVSGFVGLLVKQLRGLGVGVYFVNRDRNQPQAARDQAQKNLVRAEANLDLAHRAVDQCFLVATEDPRLQTDRNQNVRKLLLKKALPFYEGFESQRPDDRG